MIVRLLILTILSSLSLQVLALQNSRLSLTGAVDEWTPQDTEAEIFFGRSLAAKLLGQSKLYEDDIAHGYINQLGASLAKNSSRPDLAFYFAILDDDRVNAFAAPGGYVFITRAAIEFCESEAELAGILAHEIAHISERHIVKQLNIRGKKADHMTGLLSSMIMGGGQTVSAAFNLAMDEALDTWYGEGLKDRKDEYEADKVSTEILLKTGYDPRALANYLDRVKAYKAETQDRARTHPPYDLRIDAIKEQINGFSDKTSITEVRNPHRLSYYLTSIFDYARHEQLAQRILLQTPAIASQDFQRYLNQLQGAVFAVQGQNRFVPIFAVLTDEIFYRQYDYFEVVSTGLLTMLESEAEVSALMVAAKMPNNSALSDEKISLVLMNLGYSPQAWLNLLRRLPDQLPENGDLTFFENAQVRVSDLESQLPELGEFRVERWRTRFNSALVSTNQQGLEPVVTVLAPQSNPKSDRYLNLVAYAVAKTLAIEFEGVLVVESDMPIVRMQSSHLLVSTQSLRQIHNEAEWAGLVANTLFYNLGRSQDKKRLADQLYLDADIATSLLIKDLGYPVSGWLAYLQRQKLQNRYSVVDFPKTNFLVRAKALADQLNVNQAAILDSELHTQRYQHHIQN